MARRNTRETDELEEPTRSVSGTLAYVSAL
jgi:hypothetical protein